MAELIALTGQPGGFGNFQGWGGGGSSVDWGGILGGIGGAIGGILADRRRARQPLTAMPFVAGPLGRAAPWLLGGGLGSILPDIFGGGEGGVIQPSTPGVFAGGPLDVFRPDFFMAGRSTIRAKRLIAVNNPVTGNIHYWGHLGQPRWDRGCQHVSVGRKRARRRRKRY